MKKERAREEPETELRPEAPPARRAPYEPPRIVFEAPITVQCGVCDAYPYKSGLGCEFPNS